MKVHMWCVVGVLFCAVLMAQPAHAQPVVIYNGPIMPSTIINTCTGETVVLTGTTVITMYTRPNPNGGTHFTFRQIDKGQGITLDMSKKYILNNEQVDESNGDLLAGPFEITNVHNEGLIRQAEISTPAGGDDFFVKSTAHVTINSSGIPTATVSNSKGGCM